MQILHIPCLSCWRRTVGGGGREINLCCWTQWPLCSSPCRGGRGRTVTRCSYRNGSRKHPSWLHWAAGWLGNDIDAKKLTKLPRTAFLKWNKEMRWNFKAWGDPYKSISTDENFPVQVAAPLPAVARPPNPPFVLLMSPMNVVLLPAFAHQQPQGPRFRGALHFPNPFALLQQHDKEDESLYKNLDDTVILQPPKPLGTRMKAPFPAPRTKLSKSSNCADKVGLQSGFHTADKGTKTKTNVNNIPTPDASFHRLVAQEKQDWEQVKVKLWHQQDQRDTEIICRDFGLLSSRDTQSSGCNLEKDIFINFYLHARLRNEIFSLTWFVCYCSLTSCSLRRQVRLQLPLPISMKWFPLTSPLSIT